MNKRAVSPLIATILLIAFAVSIGAVIMNWTSTATGVSSHEIDGECAKVSIKVISKAGNDLICLDRDKEKIFIDLENEGTDLAGLRISYIGHSSDYKDSIIKIEAGVLAKVPVSYDPVVNGELVSVKITPIVGTIGNYVYCTESGETFQTIADCE